MAFTAIMRRAVAVTAGALALSLGLSVPALAHVTVNPRTAEKGSWTKLAFRVPNERDNASTTKVEIEFPTDNPLPFVSVRPVPGWDVEVTRGKLPQPVVNDAGDEITESVLKITWSGGKIDPGQFQEFEASVGPLPKSADQLEFPSTQTYSNGEVVKWAEPANADGSEPAHPVPVLKLVDPAGGGSGHGQEAEASATPSDAVAVREVSEEGSSDGTARLLAGVGIAVGVAGAAVGVAGLRRRA